MGERHHNGGLRKRCDCPRRGWAKCPHDWHFSFKWGLVHWRFSLDRFLNTRLKSKEDALAEVDRIRGQIRAGTFTLKPTAGPIAGETLTFQKYAEIWFERANRPARDESYTKSLAAAPTVTGERLGEKAITAITEDDLELVFGHLKGRGLAASTRNHHLQTIKNMQRWGRKKGYLTKLWLGQDAEIKREKAARRHRRLAPGEEAALLGAASPWLQRMIIAAIETGCRRGELLSLQWQDVSLRRGEIVIRAEKAKTKTQRVIVVSPRLRGVLELLRHDPEGKEHKPLAFVFGDAVGGRVGSFANAWEAAILRAHGHRAHRTTTTKALTPRARAAYAAIGLCFHDLRHEAGSRMVEAGWPLHHVQQMLGHANLSQTSTYLNATSTGLQDSMRRFGTKPLHDVAPATNGDHSTTSNEILAESAKPLVN